MALEISRPWARAASTLPGTGGGFLTVLNTGAEADRLLAASTPAAETVEIHAIKMVGPGTKMRPVEKGLLLPSGGTIVLKPRGYHLLLKGLKAPLTVGAKVPVTLTFEKAEARTVDMIVEAPGLVGEDILNDELAAGQPG